MLLNYLKIAWRVLLRRKFFTFISLFGISFTLMVLLVVVAAIDHVSGAHAPEKRIDRMLFVNLLRQTFKDGGRNNTPVSAHFVDTYVRTMHTPELVAMSSITSSATSFAGNQTLTLAVRTLEIGPYRYRVAGVVPNVPAIRLDSSADVWLPYTLNAAEVNDQRLSGSYFTIILAPSTAAVPEVRAEFDQVMRRIPLPDPKLMQKLSAHADPPLAGFVRQLTAHEEDVDDGMTLFLTGSTLLALLFMLLPALNLVNLNLTRIMERASEIGVRKAFGASRQVLVGQFLIENLVLAVLGGVLGLGLATLALSLLNESHFIAYSHFGLSWRAFAIGMGLTVAFGLMSGVYPAWKMARLNPNAALRGGLQ